MMSDKFTTRDWKSDDMEKLSKMHAEMNVGYPLPESFGPIFPILKTVVDENGNIIGMAAVKIVSEGFLWLDPSISSLKRAKCVRMLNEECQNQAKGLGLEEISCWIPERISKCFSRIIEKLGWKPSPWRNWSVILK